MCFKFEFKFYYISRTYIISEYILIVNVQFPEEILLFAKICIPKLGQAAETAVALAKKEQKNLRDANINKLREKLRAEGFMI